MPCVSDEIPFFENRYSSYKNKQNKLTKSEKYGKTGKNYVVTVSIKILLLFDIL